MLDRGPNPLSRRCRAVPDNEGIDYPTVTPRCDRCINNIQVLDGQRSSYGREKALARSAR